MDYDRIDENINKDVLDGGMAVMQNDITTEADLLDPCADEILERMKGKK